MINIDKQKDFLEKELIQLEKELDMLGRKDSNGSYIVVPDEGDGDHADPIDNADITEDFEEKVARLNVLEESYIQVKKALEAIEAGTYGVCEVSGETISEERLLAYPAATTCRNHAE